MAKSKGLSQKAAIDWWNENGVKPDTKKAKVFKQGREFGMPIFSQRPGGWQFDTVCPKKSGGKYFLWFTNVNTKETRAYEMDNKDSASVKEAMKKFLVDTKDNKNNPRPVTQLTSDRDKAYSTEDMLQFFRDNDIDIAVLTLPKTSAVGVADRLAQNGIKAIWNFAHVDLNLPKEIQVENVHLSDSLMKLSYNLTRYRKEQEE